MTTFLDQFYGIGFINHPVSDELVRDSWRQAMMAGSWPTIAAAKAWATTDFRPDLRAFEGIPTLIIHGTSDKNVPIDATGREAAKALPNAAFKEYDGSPHGIFATDKDRLIGDLVEFFGSHSTRGTAMDESRSAIPLTS